MPITLRNNKGSSLTYTELDNNFTDLDTRLQSASSSSLPPVEITASTVLTEVAHANRQLHVISGTPVTLTLPSTATTGARFFGVNLGAGAVSVVKSGGVHVPANAILPSTIDQFSAFEVWKTSSDYVRIA